MTTFFYLIVILAVGTLGAIIVNLLTRDTRRPDTRLVAALIVLIVLGATVQTLKETRSPHGPEKASPITEPAESIGLGPSAAPPVITDSPAAALPEESPVRSLTTYIEELEAAPDSDPYDNRDVAEINGTSYPHSQAAQFCFGSNRRNWAYVLGRSYKKFRATVGLSDNSTEEALVRYEIFADGRRVYLRDASLGSSFPVDVSVEGVLRLRLVTTLLSEVGGCGAATAEWGEVRAERE